MKINKQDNAATLTKIYTYSSIHKCTCLLYRKWNYAGTAAKKNSILPKKPGKYCLRLDFKTTLDPSKENAASKV